MKKFINHLLTIATALAFVITSCGGGTDIVSSTFSSSSADINNDLATLGIVADSYTNSNPEVIDVAIADGVVKLTSKSAGTSVVTLSGSSSQADVSLDAAALLATLDITVSEIGKITYSITRPDGTTKTGGGNSGSEEPTNNSSNSSNQSSGPSSSNENGAAQEAPQEAEVANAEVKIVKSEGYLNSAYIVFEQLPGKEYSVLCDGVEIDEQLIRFYDTYKYNTYDEATGWTEHSLPNVVRADALGLTAGNHTMKVAVKGGTSYSTAEMKVLSHDRSGFAFTGTTTPGAYKADGTLKDGAVVIYLTHNNKGSLTATFGGKTYTGIKDITQAIKKKNTGNTAIDIRIIGKVKAESNDLSCQDMNSAYAIGVKEASQVTIEGVGHDATLFAAGVAAFKSEYIEIANLGLMKWGGGHDGDGVSLKEDSYAWVHHCDFFYGDAGGDKDQAKGDGSMDMKDDSNHVTVSYNHFWDSGKMSLCGMKSESGPNYITYHHNWFDHSDSRHPRIRTMTVHVYNNYFDGNSKYGVGVTTGASCFVEGNFFRNAHDPMMSSKQGTDAQGDGTFSGENGGVIKSYNNKFAENNTNGVKFQFVTNKYDYTNNQAVGNAVTKTETIGTDNGDGTWTIYSWSYGEALPSFISKNSATDKGATDSTKPYYQVSKEKTAFNLKVPSNASKVVIAAKSASSGVKSATLKVGGVSQTVTDGNYPEYTFDVSSVSSESLAIVAGSEGSINIKSIKVIAPTGWSTTYTTGSSVSLDDIDAYEVDNRSDTVPETVTAKAGGTKYSNFDTVMGDSGLGLSRLPTGPEAAKTDVLTYSGRRESDFAWSFNNSADDASYSLNEALNTALVSYTTGFNHIQGTTAGGTPVSTGGSSGTGSEGGSGSTGGSGSGSEGGSGSTGGTTPTSSVTAVTVTANPTSIASNGTTTLTATVTGDDTATVTWTVTSNSSAVTLSATTSTAVGGVATVTLTGKDPTSAKTVKVTATAGNVTSSACSISVAAKETSSGGTSGGSESSTPVSITYPTTSLVAGEHSASFDSIGFSLINNTGNSSITNKQINVFYGDYLAFHVSSSCTLTATIGNKGCKVVKSDGTVKNDMGSSTGNLSVTLEEGDYYITTGTGVASGKDTRLKPKITVTYN